jgi:hypothetical protein
MNSKKSLPYAILLSTTFVDYLIKSIDSAFAYYYYEVSTEYKKCSKTKTSTVNNGFSQAVVSKEKSRFTSKNRY